MSDTQEKIRYKIRENLDVDKICDFYVEADMADFLISKEEYIIDDIISYIFNSENKK